MKHMMMILLTVFAPLFVVSNCFAAIQQVTLSSNNSEGLSYIGIFSLSLMGVLLMTLAYLLSKIPKLSYVILMLLAVPRVDTAPIHTTYPYLIFTLHPITPSPSSNHTPPSWTFEQAYDKSLLILAIFIAVMLVLYLYKRYCKSHMKHSTQLIIVANHDNKCIKIPLKMLDGCPLEWNAHWSGNLVIQAISGFWKPKVHLQWDTFRLSKLGQTDLTEMDSIISISFRKGSLLRKMFIMNKFHGILSIYFYHEGVAFPVHACNQPQCLDCNLPQNPIQNLELSDEEINRSLSAELPLNPTPRYKRRAND